MFGFVGSAQENSKNQYDYAGKLHNDILTQVLKTKGTGNLSVNEVCNLVDKFGGSNSEYQELTGSSYETIDSKEVSVLLEDSSSNFDNVINKSSISNNAKNQIISLRNYILSIEKTNDSYSDVYNYIVKFEDSILNNKELSTEDKKNILSLSSTARYSAYFWNNYYSDTVAKHHWWLIILGDAIGMIDGPGTAVAVSTLVDQLTNDKP